MKALLLLTACVIAFNYSSIGQRACTSAPYQQYVVSKDATIESRQQQIENFTRQYLANTETATNRVTGTSIIKIPVVIHNLYHDNSQKITDAQVIEQIEILNKAFRRKNADTVNTPSRFKALAADVEIEFQLAISDPNKRGTSGIIRKYTPILEWKDDDKVKMAAEMGDDAWDSRYYLNIWVCNLDRLAGYASMPGGAAERDGVVLGLTSFGMGGRAGFDLGKTAVHEVGHWLNLKHLWGDEYCGDDGVGDTPKQSGYNVECPTGIQVTCGTGTTGDMYMNYMDFTNDACMNLFTVGQKSRMRALFANGGARYSMLASTGLQKPLFQEAPTGEEGPTWLQYNLYPNPASREMVLDVSHDTRWIGKTLRIVNLQGQVMMQVNVTTKLQRIDVSQLKAGMFMLTGKKDDGAFIQQKFIKL